MAGQHRTVVDKAQPAGALKHLNDAAVTIDTDNTAHAGRAVVEVQLCHFIILDALDAVQHDQTAVDLGKSDML